MIIHSEQQMIAFGAKLAQNFTPPLTIELIGDIGTGKTTFTKGIAKTLGILEPITSPSFTISKTYQAKAITLNHFDFYRLSDPGIMAEDLAQSIADPHTITIIEWGETVANVLPANHTKITITYNDDGSRTVEVSS